MPAAGLRPASALGHLCEVLGRVHFGGHAAMTSDGKGYHRLTTPRKAAELTILNRRTVLKSVPPGALGPGFQSNFDPYGVRKM